MSKLVVTLYPEFKAAEQAVRDVLKEGFTRLDLSLVANDAGGRFRAYVAGEERPVQSSDIHSGAGVGTLEGDTGGIFSDFISMDLPGIGQVASAGLVAERFRHLEQVEGKDLYRGLLGALIELGVPEVPAHYYAEGIRRGGILIALYTADHLSGRVREIMNLYKPVDIYAQAEEWSRQGWSGFEPDAPPLPLEEIEAEQRWTETDS